MEYSDVIKQLENITVDESKYNRKDYYRKFITVRNHYLAAIHPIPLLHALKITASLKAMLPINITRIEQLTLVGYQPEPNLIASNNHRFIKSLYDAFDKAMIVK